MVFFIIISVLLHIFTILALVILYQRSTVVSSEGLLPTEDIAEIKQHMQSYISEIEQENEVFYEKVNQLFANRLLHLEDKLKDMEKKLESLESIINTERTEVDGSSEKMELTESSETGFPERKQVLELYKQGFNVEQISKSLQIGKGEVSLMLNLFDQQDEKK